MAAGFCPTFSDAWLLDGARTPFVDYNGALGLISPIDLGIKAGRAALKKSGIDSADSRHGRLRQYGSGEL
ncbi:hypothetical protein [Breoghania sp.]|uniref:hypothetical protein n=1 Tax=Breoghania sp. TaxID=2065378 RepID=UPI00260B81EF|nr:hypothetical protein [Breoghania sp.]MDJ0931617.1 hypothetical protein [Breoghania sp.]